MTLAEEQEVSKICAAKRSVALRRCGRRRFVADGVHLTIVDPMARRRWVSWPVEKDKRRIDGVQEK